ncbi:MAG: NUDIX domain-containing protein [Desulfonatronovibrio sp.]|nr:NUDIX domain-containing protein [Desulfovibrionales bacterium]
MKKTKKIKHPHKTEYLEVMDATNRPLSIMPRLEVHRQGLFHRSVIALAYDSNYRLLLQKRTKNRTIYPGRWDLSATGHAAVGESTLESAMRELKEEVGIVPTALKLVTVINGSSNTNFEFIYLYSAGRRIGVPIPNPEEVEDIIFVSKEDLGSMVREFPDILTPGLVYLWERDFLFPRL